MYKNRKAFSIIEIAIVIAIIGLLVSATVASTALIKQSRLKKIIAEIRELESAIHSFYSNYDYLPGDFPYASMHWGTDACKAEGKTARYGANGNGDDEVSPRLLAAVAGQRDANIEAYTSWCHLYEAGLSKQQIVPSDRQVHQSVQIGKHLPKSDAVRDGCYTLKWGTSARTEFALGDPTTFLFVTGKPLEGLMYKNTSILTVSQAYNIDKKIDSAIPGKGKFRCTHGFELPTGSDACVKNSKYNLNNSNKKRCTCGLIVKTERNENQI